MVALDRATGGSLSMFALELESRELERGIIAGIPQGRPRVVVDLSGVTA